MDNRSAEPNEPEDALARPVSRRRAALWGAGFGYTSVALVVVRNLALVPFLVRAIGEREYGAWLATGAVLVQLTNIDFGQRVARAYGARAREELEPLVGSGLAVAVGIATCVGAAAALIAPPVAGAMDLGSEATRRLTECIWIACGANVLHVAAFGFAEVLKNLQRPALPGAQATLGEAASLAVTLWLLGKGHGLYAISFGLLLRGSWLLVGNSLAFLRIGIHDLALRPRWSTALVRSLFQDSFYLFGTQLAFRLRSTIDPFLVGLVMGPTAAGVFALTLRAHETVKLLTVQLGLATLPGMAHLLGEQARDRFRAILAARYKMQMLVGAIGLGGCIAFNQTFVGLWVGPEFFAGNAANLLFALGGLATMLAGVSYDGLFALGDFRTIVRLVWLEALGRLPFVLLALWAGGLTAAAGAIFATSLVLSTVPLTLALVRRLGSPAWERRRLSRDVAAVVFALSALSVATLAWVPEASSWLGFAGVAAVFAGTATLLAALLDPAFARFLCRRGAGSPFSGEG